MYTKNRKQKLLGRRPWVVALTAVVVFSSFAGFFGMQTPGGEYLEDIGLSPPKAFAQNAEEANQACANYFESIGESASTLSERACRDGYIAAQGGASKEAACSNYQMDGASESGNARFRQLCAKGVDLAAADPRGPLGAAGQVGTDIAITELCKKGDTQRARDACAAGYRGALDGKSKEEVCGNANDKRACNEGYDEGKKIKDAAVAAEAAAGKDQADCDATDAILSWIICPIVDLGVKFTDFVFEDIVRPLLESVPVSTDPDHGSYKAWSTFRVLANILLVGSLLAIVYSQARGGK